MLGALLEVEMSKKCTPLWREAHLEVKSVKQITVSDHFCKLGCGFAWPARGIVHLVKSEQKRWEFSSISKNDWQAWEIWRGSGKRCISHGRRSTKDMFIRDVRRSGRWFSERGCVLEHQIFRFAKMILRDRCSTSYDLALLFHGRRSTLHWWSGKNAKRIGTRPSALHSTFQFWRKCRWIASFLMLSTSKIEKVSQTGFVFELVSSKNENVSQNCFLFKLAERQTDR